MRNFKEKFTQFMSGRYGMDQLNNALFVSDFALIILGTFIMSPIISSFTLVITFFAMYRLYSRDISKRTLENKKFMKLWKPVRRNFSVLRLKIRERKTHRFRTCPNCKIVIRTSRNRGLRAMRCPRCKTEFKTNIYL